MCLTCTLFAKRRIIMEDSWGYNKICGFCTSINVQIGPVQNYRGCGQIFTTERKMSECDYFLNTILQYRSIKSTIIQCTV